MDFNAVCRTCLGNMSLKPIFPLPSNHKAFSQAISLVTGVKIAINDGFPQNICLQCLKQVNDAIKFKAKCRQTDHILKEINATIDKLVSLNNHIPEDTVNKNNTDTDDEVDSNKADSDEVSDPKYEIEIDYAGNETSAVDSNTNFKYLMEQHAVNAKKNESSNETATVSLDKVKVEPKSDNDISSENDKPLQYLEKHCRLNEKKREINARNISPVNIVKIEPMSDDDDETPLKYLQQKSLNRKQKECNYKTNEILVALKTEAEIKKEVDDSIIFSNFDDEQATHNVDLAMNSRNQNDHVIDEVSDTGYSKTVIEGNQKNGQISQINIDHTGSSQIVNNDLKSIDFMNLYDTETKDSTGKTVICKICHKRVSKQKMQDHLSRIHRNLDPRRVKCRFCNCYIMRYKMRQHMHDDHSNGTVMCKFCKGYFEEKTLPKHLDTCTVRLLKMHQTQPTETDSMEWVTDAPEELATQYLYVNGDQPIPGSEESISYINVAALADGQHESDFAIQLMPVEKADDQNAEESDTYIIYYDDNTTPIQELATVVQIETGDDVP